MEKAILQDIWEIADRNPGKPCIFEKEIMVTYGEFRNAICNNASILKQYGINKGERVAIVAEQSIRFVSTLSAIHLIGAVAIPLEKKLPEKRVKEVMDNLEVSCLICSEKTISFQTKCIQINKFSGYIDSEKICNDEFEFPTVDMLADILFTTGTTGAPKGIKVTHLANSAIAENVIDSVELEENDIELIPTPVNHSLGLRRYYAAMKRGSTMGLIDGVIYTEDFYLMLRKYKVTAVTLVPTMLSILLKFSKDRLREFNNQLHFIQLGSAPISQVNRESLCEILPDVRLYNTYGATEAGCTCILDFNKIRNKMFCIGRLTVNSKLTFVDDEGNEIESSKEHLGQLVFEGPMLMQGYWGEPDLSRKVLRGGKIYTNDIGYLGEDGLVYLLGRKGDVINSGGNKIAPFEIEETLLKNEKIEECACIPIKDKIAGQVPKLFVVMKKGVTFNQQEILLYLAERLEAFKVPKYVELVEKLPRAYNGKLLRKELIEEENSQNE